MGAAKSPRAVIDDLRNLFGDAIDIITACKLRCFRSADGLVKGIIDNGTSSKEAFQKLSDSLKTADDFGVDATAHLKVAEYLGQACDVFDSGLRAQAACDPTKAFDNLKALYGGVKKLPASFTSRFSLEKVSKNMEILCCDGEEVIEGSARLIRKIRDQALGDVPANPNELAGFLAQLEYSTFLKKRPFAQIDSIEKKVGDVDYDTLWTNTVELKTYVEEFALNGSRLKAKLDNPAQVNRLISFANENGYIPRLVVDSTSDLTQATKNQASALGIQLVNRFGEIIR